MSFLSTIQSIFSRKRPRPRVYVCAPNALPLKTRDDAGGLTTALILPALDEAGSIAGRVRAARERYQAVIVLDGGSHDATPHLAAEAGATVVLCAPGQDVPAAIQRCAELGFQLAD